MKTQTPLHKFILALGVTLLLLMVLAWWFPVHAWGINFLAYASPMYLGVAIVAAVGLGLPCWSLLELKFAKIPRWVWSLSSAAIMWVLFFFLYIDTEVYGDALLNIKVLSDGGDWAERYHIISGSTFNIFTPKNGEQFTFSIVKAVSRMTGLSIWATFRGYSSLFGAVWVFVWMQFVQSKVRDFDLRLLAMVLGLGAGATMTFYAMPEVYAPPLLFFTSYFICLVQYLDTRKRLWLWLLFPLLLMCIRTHSSGFVIAPTLIYALLVAASGNNERWRAWLGWRRLGWMIPALFIAIGAAGYLTLFKAGDDSVKVIPTAGNMFLTPFGGDNPDDAYFLFGPWHIWDFAQELLFCSVPMVVLLLAFILAPGRKKWLQGPTMVGLGIGSIMLLALYFLIDPHVTMPRDWDLFSMVSPPLLVACVVLLDSIQEPLQPSSFRRVVLFLLITLQWSFVGVNHDKRRVHERQLDVAQHIFAIHEPGGAFIVKHTLDAMPVTAKERLSLLKATLARLAPYENAINNVDFAFLYQYGGILSAEIEDFPAAVNYYLEADKRVPGQLHNYEDLAVVEFNQGHFEQAVHFSIMAQRAGSKRSSNWVLGFLAAQNLGDARLAIQIGQDYLGRFGDPDGIGPQIAALQATLAGGNATNGSK